MRFDSPWNPISTCFRAGHLPVEDGHRVAWEVVGPDGGIPIVCIDFEEARSVILQLIGTRRFRVVLFDRRGCGKSTPLGRLTHNSMSELLSDLERLRALLGIERWLVCGRGRGTTVALRYAQSYPNRCLGLLLSGVMLDRPQDREWWWSGPRALFPDLWHELRAGRGDSDEAGWRSQFLARCLHDDPAVWMPAALAAARYELQLMDSTPNPERLLALELASESQAATQRVSLHFDSNDDALLEEGVLGNVAALKHIPMSILQGRYDTIAPPGGAFELARRISGAHIDFVPAAGNGWRDAAMSFAVPQALQRFSGGQS